jgi:hypothetical protein
MDLKTFVAQTLIQIVEGVNDAKNHINALGIGAAVNPETTFGSDGPPHAAARNVEFDVAGEGADGRRKGTRAARRISQPSEVYGAAWPAWQCGTEAHDKGAKYRTLLISPSRSVFRHLHARGFLTPLRA